MGQLPIAVLGASGYAGAESLRLLAGHPETEVVVAAGGRAAGQRVGAIAPHLSALADLPIGELDPGAVIDRAEVALLALPHEESARLAPVLLEGGVRVIDLSGAFRLPAEDYPAWYGFAHPAPAWLGKAVYGLPELFGEQIVGAELVANPGCYPTAAALALAPLVRAGLVEASGIVIDAKSGISGAGRTPTDVTHFATADGSIRPYAAGGAHRHTPEIERAIGAATGAATSVSFVPHLVPATRGLVATCFARAPAGLTTGAALAVLTEAYAGAPFVRVLPAGSLPDSKRTTGANVVEIGAAIDARTGTAVVVAALDNLVKGAAGQAVQNLNLMMGYAETAGLEAMAVYP